MGPMSMFAPHPLVCLFFSGMCVFWSAAFIHKLFHIFIFFLFLEKGQKSNRLPYHPREILLTRPQGIRRPTRNRSWVSRMLSACGWSLNSIVSLIFYLTEHRYKIILSHPISHRMSLRHTHHGERM